MRYTQRQLKAVRRSKAKQCSVMSTHDRIINTMLSDIVDTGMSMIKIEYTDMFRQPSEIN